VSDLSIVHKNVWRIDSTWDRMEGEKMEKYQFFLEGIQMYDPFGNVGNHITEMRIGFPYKHEKNEDEEPKKRALTYEEVLNNL
jgi:hypothetical protein